MSSTVSTATPPSPILPNTPSASRIDAVKSRSVEGGAETLRALVRAEEMKALVRVFREHQTGEETGRFFLRLRLWLGAIRFRAIRLAVRSSVRRFLAIAARLDFLQRLEIHLPIGAIQIRKLSRQTVAEQITRDLARLIDFRQRQTRQRQTSRRARDRNSGFDLVPALRHFASEFLVRAGALYLFVHELFVLLHRFDDCSQFAHLFLPFAFRARRSLPPADLRVTAAAAVA